MDALAFDRDGFLDTWFGDTRENPDGIADRKPWWFEPNPERDRQLEALAGHACEAAGAGRLDTLAETPRGCLSLILLLDQLPRNLYRGTAAAFASDARALELCLEGHRSGLDQPLTLIERVFFWMPLQHAEDLERQELGVQLFTSLAGEDPERDALWSEFADFAELHHDIIQRFGRFPHRNAALGRATTDREEAWLEAGGATFGQ
jgi:uncharacterized protein (DUF924 family)